MSPLAKKVTAEKVTIDYQRWTMVERSAGARADIPKNLETVKEILGESTPSGPSRNPHSEADACAPVES